MAISVIFLEDFFCTVHGVGGGGMTPKAKSQKGKYCRLAG